jgi:hypothetical protein
MLSNGFWRKKVKVVEKWNDRLTVFNVQTEPEGTFIANGVSVHNCKFVTVRLNMIHGKIDPERFAKLYNEMADKYGSDALQDLMGATDAKGYQKLLASVSKGLGGISKKLKKEFDESAKEAKTVEELTTLLQELFAKYGDTMDLNFMVFVHGKKEHIYISMDPKMKASMEKLVEYCKLTKTDINTVIQPLAEDLVKRLEALNAEQLK